LSQYQVGTVQLTNGSQAVVGTGTAFLANAHAGDILTVQGENAWYDIGSVTNDTQITLVQPYVGTSGSGKVYVISSSFTPNAGLPYPEQNDVETASLFKRAMLYVESLFTGRLVKSVAGNLNVTLTAVECRNRKLQFNGLLTGNIIVYVPAKERAWVVFNNTSGIFTLTVKTLAGSGVAVTQGTHAQLACDGLNVIAESLGGSGGGGPATPSVAISGVNGSYRFVYMTMGGTPFNEGLGLAGTLNSSIWETSDISFHAFLNSGRRCRMVAVSALSNNFISDAQTKCLAALNSAPADFGILVVGNGMPSDGLSGDAIWAGVKTVLDQAGALGVMVFVPQMIPASLNDTVGERAAFDSFHELLLSYAESNAHVIYVPSQHLVQDQATYPAAYPALQDSAGSFYQRAHVHNLVGNAIAEAINQQLVPNDFDGYPHQWGAANFLSAAFAQVGASPGNFFWTGTGGTKNAGVNASSPTPPAGWQFGRTGGAGGDGFIYQVPRKWPMASWVAGATYALGDMVLPSSGDQSKWAAGLAIALCTTAGAAHAATEPSWTSVGFRQTLVDNACTWTMIPWPPPYPDWAATTLKLGTVLRAAQEWKLGEPFAVLVITAGATGGSALDWKDLALRPFGYTQTDGTVTFMKVPKPDGGGGNILAWLVNFAAGTTPTYQLWPAAAANYMVLAAPFVVGASVYFEQPLMVGYHGKAGGGGIVVPILSPSYRDGASTIISTASQGYTGGGWGLGLSFLPPGRKCYLRSKEHLIPANSARLDYAMTMGGSDYCLFLYPPHMRLKPS